jgi:multiple sugar transport system ATP-binding protein
VSAPALGLVLRGLRRTYPGPVVALADFDLEIGPGELVAVLGPSGSGKTTLLRLVAGLDPPTSGEILLDGAPLDGRPPRERDVAIVFQSHSLFPHLSAFDNVAFGLRLRGTGAAETRARVEEAARVLGVDGLLDRLPHSLSVGERQRVALARALVRRPRVFLLDEPLSGVDANHRAALRAEIRRIHSELRAITIVVTHDQGEAMSLADRVVLLRDGRTEQVGPPVELYREPANRFVAGFVGSPPMNLVVGELRLAAGEVVFAGGGLRLALASRFANALENRVSRPVTLGLRPEHLRVAGRSSSAGRRPSARLEGLEAQGPLTYARLRFGGFERVGLVVTDPPPPPGSDVELDIDTTRACLFDEATGQALHECRGRDVGGPADGAGLRKATEA